MELIDVVITELYKTSKTAREEFNKKREERGKPFDEGKVFVEVLEDSLKKCLPNYDSPILSCCLSYKYTCILFGKSQTHLTKTLFWKITSLKNIVQLSQYSDC